MPDMRTFALGHGATFHRHVTCDDPIVLAEGTRVGCEAGHVCWTARRHIYRRQTIGPEDMAPAPFQTTPAHSRRMGFCICGRGYTRTLLDPAADEMTPRPGAILAFHIVGQGWMDVRRA